MVDILVKRDFSAADVKRARLAAAQFQRNRSTSDASNVLDQAELKKALVFCPSHSLKFATGARAKGYVKQREFPFVNGDCDACGVFGAGDLYLHESSLQSVWIHRQKELRALEYRRAVA